MSRSSKSITDTKPVGRYETLSEEETCDVGEMIGKIIQGQDIIVLTGDIGSGKTYLSKGLAIGLGVDKKTNVNSPAYDLVHIFDGKLPVFHFDFYRIGQLDDYDYGWIDEYLEQEGVSIIEWGEKFIKEFNRPYVQVCIDFCEEENLRVITIFCSKDHPCYLSSNLSLKC